MQTRAENNRLWEERHATDECLQKHVREAHQQHSAASLVLQEEMWATVCLLVEKMASPPASQPSLGPTATTAPAASSGHHLPEGTSSTLHDDPFTSYGDNFFLYGDESHSDHSTSSHCHEQDHGDKSSLKGTAPPFTLFHWATFPQFEDDAPLLNSSNYPEPAEHTIE